MRRSAEAPASRTVERVPADRITIFGHSLGTALAIELATRVSAAGVLPCAGRSLALPYDRPLTMARNELSSAVRDRNISGGVRWTRGERERARRAANEAADHRDLLHIVRRVPDAGKAHDARYGRFLSCGDL